MVHIITPFSPRRRIPFVQGMCFPGPKVGLHLQLRLKSGRHVRRESCWSGAWPLHRRDRVHPQGVRTWVIMIQVHPGSTWITNDPLHVAYIDGDTHRENLTAEHGKPWQTYMPNPSALEELGYLSAQWANVSLKQGALERKCQGREGCPKRWLRNLFVHHRPR